MLSPNFLLATALCFFLGVLSWTATGMLRPVLSRHALDVPNERSAHSRPLPRGGGIAIWFSCSIGLILLALWEEISLAMLLAFLGAGSLATFSGFLDDMSKQGIRAETRLLFHLCAVAWGIWQVGGIETVRIGDVIWHWGAGEQILLAVVMVWIINLTNFMDGLNGLAASESLFVFLVAGVLGWLSGDAAVLLLCLLPACATAGFLPWNAGRAKIFLGDAGAYFLGMMIALLALVSARNGSVSPWCWMILFAVFLGDSGIALLRRMAGSLTAWKEPHRTHACQHLSRYWRSHTKVCLGVVAINLLVLAPVATLAWMREAWAAGLAGLTLVAMILLAILLGSGVERDHSPGADRRR